MRVAYSRRVWFIFRGFGVKGRVRRGRHAVRRGLSVSSNVVVSVSH